MFALIVSIFLSCLTWALERDQSLVKADALVDVSTWPGLRLDIRYATANNFLHQPIYGDKGRCVLHSQAAAKLKDAVARLERENSDYQLLIFDCLRPRSMQKKLWAFVKGTPQHKYVANPESGSIHNFGFAVDVSLVAASGQELDMGTPFDFFGDLAEPRKESEMIKANRLTPAQLQNRLRLRKIMESAGFTQLSLEWWHYDALKKSELVGHFPIVE